MFNMTECKQDALAVLRSFIGKHLIEQVGAEPSHPPITSLCLPTPPTLEQTRIRTQTVTQWMNEGRLAFLTEYDEIE